MGNFRDGELVLVDGGSEYHCFSSDVTRTFPVNGKFSDAQKEIYQAVLDAQKFCIEVFYFLSEFYLCKNIDNFFYFSYVLLVIHWTKSITHLLCF